jgi:O-acetyl-ADP-ribose deacetylase (regulator of RNase III)
MNIVSGDLIDLAKEGYFDIIVHGCNCFCTMGKGIAVQIKQEFPEAYQEDLRTTKGDESKLGTFSSAYIDRYDLTVINAYSQYDYRPTYKNDGVTRCDYEAIRKVFRKIAEDFDNTVRIGYPKIGCGLAGGDWDLVSKIIDEELRGFNHTLVDFQP